MNARKLTHILALRYLDARHYLTPGLENLAYGLVNLRMRQPMATSFRILGQTMRSRLAILNDKTYRVTRNYLPSRWLLREF
jgi:hypothetical protein